MHQYFKKYADHFGLQSHIVLNTRVTGILRDEKTSKWLLSLESGGEGRTERFDKVVISNGIVYLPRMPQIDGSDVFEGNILHGQQYKSQV